MEQKIIDKVEAGETRFEQGSDEYGYLFKLKNRRNLWRKGIVVNLYFDHAMLVVK